MRDTFDRDPRVNALIAMQNIIEFMERIPDDPIDEGAAQRRNMAIAKLALMLPPDWTRPDRPSLAARAPIAADSASNRDDVVEHVGRVDQQSPLDERPLVPELVALSLNAHDTISA